MGIFNWFSKSNSSLNSSSSVVVNGVEYESADGCVNVINGVATDSKGNLLTPKGQGGQKSNNPRQEIKQWEIDLYGVSRIVNNFFNCTIVADESVKDERLVVCASESDYKKLFFNIKGNELSLGANRWQGAAPPVVKISVKQLQFLSTKAVGNTHASVNSDILIVESLGVGNITLEGKCNRLDIETRGVGNVNSKDLKAKLLCVSAAGVGKIHATAHTLARSSVSGVGNVVVDCEYSTQTPEISGLGKITVNKVVFPKEPVDSGFGVGEHTAQVSTVSSNLAQSTGAPRPADIEIDLSVRDINDSEATSSDFAISDVVDDRRVGQKEVSVSKRHAGFQK